MPEQILPLTGLDQTGVILDNPPVSLPPTAFSDALNVRFKDGAVRKMEGELNIFPDLNVTDDPSATIKYVAWWANPNLSFLNRGYFLVIMEHYAASDDPSRNDYAYLVNPEGLHSRKGVFQVDTNAAWQHTFFQGGFSIVINNGLEAPQYITDPDGNQSLADVPNFSPLPGWESYRINETRISDTFTDLNTTTFTLLGALAVDDMNMFTERDIMITIVRGATTRTGTATGLGTVNDADGAFLATVSISGQSTVVTFQSDPNDDNTATVQVGDQVTILERSLNPVDVTAGVVRSFGDFLVAGNLVERDQSTRAVIRSLTGVVRSSDVALPGQIPTNWNPFAAGVSTADEFVLSDTGIVQDMVELQGNLFIYSNQSISQMRQTGNVQVPLAVTPVTDSYGAQTTEAVLEFDGRHFVVGSQDIYIFGGHPGSIQSISDGRVRRRFFEELNPLHEQRMFCLRYQQRDEIWICYPTTTSISGECDRALIWNYRLNNWTIRQLDSVVSGNIGPVPGGGVPNSTISFTGQTGTNDLVLEGQNEVQEISTTSSIAAPTARNQTYTVTVNLIEGVDTSGEEAFEITLGDMFNAGTGDIPIRFTLQVKNGGSFVTGFPIDVSIGLMSATVADVIADLMANSDFTTYYTAGTLESDDTVLIIRAREGALPTHDLHRLAINGAPTDETSLTPNGQTLTATTNSLGEFSLNFSQQVLSTDPTLFFADEQAGQQIQQGTLGETTQFYGNQSGDGFYNRRAPGTGFFFGQRAGENFLSLVEPISVSTPEVRHYRLVDSDGTPVAGQTLTFTAYDNPVTTRNTSTVRVVPDVDQTGVATTVQFTTAREIYDPLEPEGVQFAGREDAANSLLETLIEDLRVIENVRTLDQVNERLAVLLMNDIVGTGRFTASIDPATPTTINVTSNAMEKRTLEFITNNEVIRDGVSIEEPTDGEGIYPYGGDGLTVIGPTYQVSGPEFQGVMDIQVMPAATDGTVTSEEIISAIADFIGGRDGWARRADTTDDGITIVETVNRDVAGTATPAEAATNPDIQDDLANRPINAGWVAVQTRRGNVEGSAPVADFNFVNSRTAGSATSTTNQRGEFPVYNVPTFIGLRVSIGAQGEEEFIVLRAGDFGISTGLSAAEAANDWASRLAIANRRLNVTAQMGQGDVTIQPRNYDELANFVIQAYFNDTADGATELQTIYNRAVDPNDSLRLNPFSDPLYFNPGTMTLVVNDSADFSVSAPTIVVDFDTQRPWPMDEINPNQEYPILSARQVLDVIDATGVASTTQTVNKVLGADIGWSRPMYSLDSGLNNSPIQYESYFERVQLPLTPEFKTEMVHSVAVWGDGNTAVVFRQPPHYNKIELRAVPTNFPGDAVDLTVRPTRTDSITNTFEISEEYKLDSRVHGRFTNFRITDDVLGFTAIDTTSFPGKTFNPLSEWRVSGLQIEFAESGRR